MQASPEAMDGGFVFLTLDGLCIIYEKIRPDIYGAGMYVSEFMLKWR